MTTFKPNDRVKVVRELESMLECNDGLSHVIGRVGDVVLAREHADICMVLLDRDKYSYFIPADMLELEVGDE